jgi:hypothetical protein
MTQAVHRSTLEAKAKQLGFDPEDVVEFARSEGCRIIEEDEDNEEPK